ncbi:MAG: cytoplasmic protein [Candidatus Eisenbacteria bacterium]|nr:cytoplasmic protein [Candidatus Latescibacterota bacterium]MBD3302791.1 cytoplasmic protein [Candidatus Eisenbacteria bacterium]
MGRDETPDGPGRLVSERIDPLAGSADPTAMSRGEPGLPAGFVWRGRIVRIREVEEVRRRFGPEPSSKERYLRRHEYRLRMEDGAIWVVYCLRQPPRGRPAGARWYLARILREAG